MAATVKVLAPHPPQSPSEVKVCGSLAVTAILTPREVYEKLISAGVGKSAYRVDKQIAAGVMAGLFLGFGFSTCMIVGGQVPLLQSQYPGLQTFLYAAFGFPLGLTLILLCGADLFTGNCNYMIIAYFEGRVTVFHIVKCLMVSYFSNLCGCLFMAKMMVWADVFSGTKKDWPVHAAQKKCSYPFGKCVAKAILANWLVNLAVWLAVGSNDFNSKYLGVWLPISAFISMGLEHCIANMFLIPLSMMLGSGITAKQFIRKNLVPATIGNFIGGAGFVGIIHGMVLSDFFDTFYSKTAHVYRTTLGRSSQRKFGDAAEKADSV